MKRQHIGILFIMACTICNMACGRGPDTTDIDVPDSKSAYVNWTDSQMLQTGALNENAISDRNRQLPLHRIDDRSGLDEFISRFEDVIELDRIYDSCPSFLDSVSNYDDAFFDSGSLMLVYVDANSGSDRFHITGVEQTGKELQVHIARENRSGIGTDDMAGWLLITEIQDDVLDECTGFSAYFTN